MTRLLILAAASLAAGPPALADEEVASKVQLVVAPYVWVPTINGNTALGPLSIPVTVTPRDLVEGIKIGGMGNLRIETKREFIFAEAIIANYDNKRFRPFFGQSLTSKIRFVELGGGLHRTVPIASDATLKISPHAGIQYLHIDSLVTGNLVTATANGSWINPVAGVIVEVPVSGRLGLVGKLDGAGFGITNTDYRSLAVLTDVRITKRLRLNAGYRWAKGRYGSDTGLALDLTGAGPEIGLQIVVPLAR